MTFNPISIFFLALVICSCSQKSDSPAPAAKETITTVAAAQPVEEEEIFLPSNTWVSGCETSETFVGYGSEIRSLTVSGQNGVETTTLAYGDAECTNPSYMIRTSGTYNAYSVSEEEPLVYDISFLRTSFKFTALDDYEVDYWNGAYTGETLCDGIAFTVGLEVELNEENCKYLASFYGFVDDDVWSDSVTIDDATITVGALSVANLHRLDGSYLIADQAAENVLSTENELPEFDATNRSTDPAAVDLLDGAWSWCEEGGSSAEKMTLTFDAGGGTYINQIESGMAAGCEVGTALYTVKYTGTYTTSEMTGVVEGFEIDYTGADITYNIHDAATLDLYNGIGADVFCTDLAFVLDTEASIIGSNCLPEHGTTPPAYGVVAAQDFYDIFAFRYGQMVRSDLSGTADGSSPGMRPTLLQLGSEISKQ